MAKTRRDNGDGSWYERPDGTLQHRFRAGKDDLGKERRLCVSGKTKGECRLKRQKLEAKLEAGLNARSGIQTLGAYLNDWVETTVRRTKAARTYHDYRYNIDKHLIPIIGDLPLNKVQPTSIEMMLTKMFDKGLHPRIQQLNFDILSGALNNAVRKRLVTENACSRVDRPQVQTKKFEVWTPEEIERFLTTAEGDRYHALYCLALATGMRQGEIFALHWSDIDFKAESIFIRHSLSKDLDGELVRSSPKTASSRRRVPIGQEVRSALRKHQERMLAEGHAGSWVFCDSAGGPLRTNNFTSRSFKPLIKKAKVRDIRFHDLRHTCATRLLVRNAHPKAVQALLGHANVQITLDTYSHLVPSIANGVADILNDEMFNIVIEPSKLGKALGA